MSSLHLLNFNALNNVNHHQKANKVKPRIFIGSSIEHLALARAVQDNLDRELETKVWDQDVFKLSEYPLIALEEELKRSDFGIFIMAPDDWLVKRGDKHTVPRDNVVFELGLFAGHLGRNQTFIIVPRGSPNLHLPTDLTGLTVGDYDANRSDGNLTAAVASVSNKIRLLITQRSPALLKQRSGLVRFGLFSDFVPDFTRLLDESTELTVNFIHSRRWRENHNEGIRTLLGKPDSSLTVFLPNLENRDLIMALMGHFDDGPHIPGFIADAYRYFADLQQEYRGKVRLLLFNIYPTYTFYKFNNDVIVAMYPTTTLRKSVPAFHMKMDGTFGEFLSNDVDHLFKQCLETSAQKLRRIGAIANSYTNEVSAVRPEVQLSPNNLSHLTLSSLRSKQR